MSISLASKEFLGKTKSKIKLCLQRYAKVGYLPLKFIYFRQTFGLLLIDLLQPAHIEMFVRNFCLYCNMSNSNFSSTKIRTLPSPFLTSFGYLNQLLFNYSHFICTKLHFKEYEPKFKIWFLMTLLSSVQCGKDKSAHP